MSLDTDAITAAVRAAVPNPPDWCLLWQWGWEAACMPRSEWASWVQAIGSVAAIGLGMWAVQRAHRLEQQREVARAEAERLSLYHGALQLVGAVYQLGKKARDHANKNRGDLRHMGDRKSVV